MGIDYDTARALYATNRQQHVVAALAERLDDPAKTLPSVVLTDGPPALWVVPAAALDVPLHHLDDEARDDMLDEIRHAARAANERPADVAQ